MELLSKKCAATFVVASGNRSLLAVCTFLILCGISCPVLGQHSSARKVPSVQNDIGHGVSPVVRDLSRIIPGTRPARRKRRLVRRIPMRLAVKPSKETDPALQTAATEPSSLSPARIVTYPQTLAEGQGYTVFTPPDPNGAAGLSQYVQIVNAAFAVYDKWTGDILAGPTYIKALWSGQNNNCSISDDGDPIVLYDRLANRWVLSQFYTSSKPFLECIAVSQTSDATGAYYVYGFEYSGGFDSNDDYPDYPKMSVWPDAYYATFVLYEGATACAYDRSKMLIGESVRKVCFRKFSKNDKVQALLPSDLNGTIPPPAGSPNFMLALGSDELNLFKFHVDFTNTRNSVLEGPISVGGVQPFNPLCRGDVECVPQFGTKQRLDSLGDRLMYRLAYRNFGLGQSLVVNHSVQSNGTHGIRWYEIRDPNGESPTVYQQGTFAPDANYRWMGSIAMDQAGNIALGYSESSADIFPSIAVTGRLANDPLNQMQQEIMIIGGKGSQEGGNHSWGDYSAMQVDPSDDCTFWYTQEYLPSSGNSNWTTAVTHFRFPNCTPADSPSSGPLTGFLDTIGVATGLTGGRDLFYAGGEGIYQLYWNNASSHSWNVVDISTAATPTPKETADGPIVGFLDRIGVATQLAGGQDLFYVGVDHNIHQLYSNTAWHSYDVTSNASGATSVAVDAPVVAFQDMVGQATGSLGGQDLFYVGGNDRHIHQLYSNKTWNAYDVTANVAGESLVVGGSPIVGFLDSVGAATGIVGGQVVFYAGTDDRIHQLSWDNAPKNPWHTAEVMLFTPAFPPPLSMVGFLDTVGVATRLMGGMDLFYVGTNNHIYHLYWNNDWTSSDLTTAVQGPKVAPGIPIVAFLDTIGVATGIVGGEILFYVGEDQEIYQLYSNNNVWQSVNVTPSGVSVPSGVKSIIGFLDTVGVATGVAGGQDVFFLAGNCMYELYGNGTAWHTNSFTLSSSPCSTW
jgi:hypothetical protein